MNQNAFFFQGTALLLPNTVPDSQLDRELSLDFLKYFENNEDAPDVFQVPPVERPDLRNAAASLPFTGVCVSAKTPLPAAWRTVPVRQTLQLLSSGMAEGKGSIGRLFRAFHIAQWRQESRFCGSCGAKNIDASAAGAALARLCPVCGRLEFPRIAPAVITIIINNEGKALLAHNKKFADGLYSLIAGFNEAGESLEATVAREIWEEVRIEVQDIRYEASQPWPFPNSLMVGFSARYASGEIQPDGVEIEDARWFSRDDLPKLPGNASVSRLLINRWIKGIL